MSVAAISINPDRLAESRRYCQDVTRRAAKNFYYGLKLLPEPKRVAMFALYTYMRLLDDVADEEDGRPRLRRKEELDAWREQTHAAYRPTLSHGHSHPIWPAFADMVQRFAIPVTIFDDAIAGQQQDLEPVVFETFSRLYEYCYRVAGTVGLASIYIWGFEGGKATEALAIDRGVAFQLTNILRDLREDLGRGRIYLPRDEIAAMNVSEEDLRRGRDGEAFRKLMYFQIDRAELYYERSQGLEKRISRDSRPALLAMTRIYHGLLKKTAAKPQRVLHERVRLSLPAKLYIGLQAAWGR